MAKYVYPAIFTPENAGMYSVVFPDIESCYTQGDNLTDAYEMAEDILCLCLYNLEQEGKAIPDAIDMQHIHCDAGSFVSLVSADTIEYRRFYDNKAVKKTLTIPSWLNDMAEKQDINFSFVLQKALKEELSIAE